MENIPLCLGFMHRKREIERSKHLWELEPPCCRLIGQSDDFFEVVMTSVTHAHTLVDLSQGHLGLASHLCHHLIFLPTALQQPLMTSPFIYHPFKNAQPLCNFAELPLYHEKGLPHAVRNRWCRFSYTKHHLSLDHQSEAKLQILIAVTRTFRSYTRSPYLNMFRSKGKWYVDLEMVNIPADQWNDTLEWRLPNGALLKYLNKGAQLPVHYSTILLRTRECNNVDILCQDVDNALKHAEIVDVWVQKLRDFDSLRPRSAAQKVRRVYLLVALYDVELHELHPSLQAFPGQVYDRISRSYITQPVVHVPTSVPGSVLRQQPGYILSEGRHHRLNYSHRGIWCSICRADAKEAHSTESCQYCICSECGVQGHLRGSRWCLYVQIRKQSRAASP